MRLSLGCHEVVRSKTKAEPQQLSCSSNARSGGLSLNLQLYSFDTVMAGY